MTTVAEQTPTKSKKRQSNAHLREVPQKRSERDRVRAEAKKFAESFDRSKPLTRDDLRKFGETVLNQLDMPECFLGFSMVCVANEFWRDQVSAIDFSRRLLLLPHCLKHAEGCPADYDEYGLDCRKCGACSVADFKVSAEDMGYKVLVSEGTPIVLKIIISGHVDAIVGVACLNVLEKAFDKILLAGVPCIAVPLLSSNCKNTSVDEDWVTELIGLRTEAPQVKTRSYVPLMRAAHGICEEPELEKLSPRLRQKQDSNGKASAGDPLAIHEKIAYDWMAQGGKRSRPFITVAAYDALNGGVGTQNNEDFTLPDSVLRTALAIEAFHKASLVHDDIEDDDTYRYGNETLHRQHGIGTAINVGDYLIGLGYRLVSKQRKELGGDCTADILDKFADAHLKLSEGQGAELLWRDAKDKSLTPLDALKIYALKTAPAFEAALYSGLRLAGPTDDYDKMVTDFSRHMGVAFQVLNDLKDWQGDEDNKMMAGQDVLAARPTLLLALALQGLPEAERIELLSILHDEMPSANGTAKALLHRVKQLYDKADVFTKADQLVEKYRARAEAIADEVEPTELRELLYYLVDTVLDREPPQPEPETLQLVQLSGQA